MFQIIEVQQNTDIGAECQLKRYGVMSGKHTIQLVRIYLVSRRGSTRNGLA